VQAFRVAILLQALAETLKDVTEINLAPKYIGHEEAKAWCSARGAVAPGLRMKRYLNMT